MKSVFVTLIRREFWESRSLWMVPLAAAVLVIGTSLFATLRLGPDVPDSVRLPQPLGNIGGMALGGFAAFLAMVGGVVIMTYLTDCLFSERKDRSILFWKSLPVSDAQTVLAKLAVGMLVMPLLLLLLAVLTHFAVTIIMMFRFDNPQLFAGYWSGWADALATVSVTGLFGLLWYAPVAAYLMLASVIAKRAPLMYVIGPPLILMLWERLMLESSHATKFIFGRVALPNAENLFGPGAEPWLAFQNSQLWIGLAVAAGMLYIVIRLRRYRDDT